MSKKAKEKIVMTVAGILGLCINAVVISFVYKWWRSILVAVIMVIICCFSILYSLVYGTFAKIALPYKEITYGEFPFEIVYSIDGEVFEKRGVIICECKRDFDLTSGASWEFDEYFDKNQDDDVLLITEDYNVRIDSGRARYYLEGKKPYEGYVPGEYIYYVFMGRSRELTYEQAKNLFGIEIISVNFSEPLVSTEDEKDN